MISLDTIEFKISTDFIQDWNKKAYTESIFKKSNKLEVQNFTLEDKPIGVSKLNINTTYNTVKCKLSAKTLKENYYQGINLNTIEQLLSYVFNKKTVILNKDYINHIELLSTDVKTDLNLKHEPNNYINSLNNLTAPKFAKTKYPTGISFNSNLKTVKTRLTAYEKEHEFKLNKKFYKEFPELISHFNNTLRIESRLPTKSAIIKHLNTTDLITILNKKEVNYNILSTIIDKQTDYPNSYNIHEMNNNQEKNFAQIYYLNEIYNGDFDMILNHIKTKLGKNTKASYQRKIIKENLAIINNSKDSNTKENIIELLDALKNENNK